jgi:predicted nucleic acid-binding protein
LILFDSDVAIDVLRGRPPAVEWFDSLPANEVLIVLGFVAMELIFGSRNSADLADTEQWHARFRTVWLEPELCQKARETLARIHLTNAIGVIDMLAAQVALSLDLPLYTFNEKHFRVVPGLRIIQPYSR